MHCFVLLKSEKRELQVTFYQSQLCLFLVSSWTKGVVSAADGGERGGGVTDTDCFERMQKIEGRERVDSQFSEHLHTSLFGQLCVDASHVTKIKIKDPKICIICPL